MNPTDKSFRVKLIITIVLTVLLLLGLLYLIFSGSADEIRRPTHSESLPPTVTPSITPTDSPEPTETAAPTDSPEPTETTEPTDSPEPTETTEPTDSPEPGYDPSADDITSDSSLTKIVNHDRSIDAEYVPDGLVLPDVDMYYEQYIRSDVEGPLEELFAAASADGYDLYLVSGFRDYEVQQILWNRYVEQYGEEEAYTIDAYPGQTEHQLGLAVDLGSADRNCELSVCFADTGTSAWLAENAWKYGFILRYPAGKEDVTGIMYSPWHYRYVGKPAAEAIRQSGLTMEEFYGI